MPTESPEVTIPDTPAPAAPTSERQDRDTRLTAIRPPTRFPRLDVRELWAFRELLGIFVWRDLKVRYKQTFVGVAWAVFQPVLVAAVYTIVFGRFAKFPSGTVYYPVFVFAGILPWQYFASSVSSGATALVSNVNLVTKVYFPRLLLPVATVIVPVVDFVLGCVVLAGLMVIWGPTPSWPDILVAPAFLGLAVVTAVGSSSGSLRSMSATATSPTRFRSSSRCCRFSPASRSRSSRRRSSGSGCWRSTR